MCGIAGIFSQSAKVNIETIKRFTDSMWHRGPDGSGYVLLNDDLLAFGHRRLSILDLSEDAAQPMTLRGRYTITYNGEVYNFIEIRQELEKDGHKFRSQSDTEVIMVAYEKWGLDCFRKFNGMWAIAIYDSDTRKLLLCRDRFGVKPLYYVHKPGQFFAFASETRAFRHLMDFDLAVNMERISWAIDKPVLMEGTGYTIWEDVYQVLPGHFMEFEIHTKNVQQKRWFQIEQKESNLSYNEAKEQFFELLQNAVKLRLRSDVPVGTALSGGIDSSSIYALLYYLREKHLSSERVDYNSIKGFAATFDGTIQEETEYANEVIKFCKGDAMLIPPDFDNMVNDIERSMKLFNDIAATPISVVANVYKGMRAEKRVVSLDGHGADEMLYGYKSLAGMAISQSIFDMDEAYEKDLTQTYLDMFNPNEVDEERKRIHQRSMNYRKLIKTDTSFGGIKFRIKKGIKSLRGSKAEHYSPETTINDPLIVRREIRKFPILTNKQVDLSYYNMAEKEHAIDFYYRNIPFNMHNFDRAAMQQGVEIRMPFMDCNLVDFTFSLPMKYKIGNGYTKLILRDCMKGLLPEKVRTRKSKIGMGAPIHDWFNDQLSAYILDIVSSQSFLSSELWHGQKVKAFVEERCKNRSWNLSDAQRFWSILNAHIILS